MKRILPSLLLLLLGFGSGACLAQVTIGLKGGATLATINETPNLGDVTNVENISGATFGAFLEFGGNSLLGFRPEAIFQQKGYQFSSLNLDSVFSERYDYLDIPVALRLHLGAPKFRLFVEGGASVGFVLKGVRRLSVNGRESEEDITLDDEFDPQGRREVPIDLAGIFGGGLEARLGPGLLSLGGRYQLDLNDFYEFEDNAPPNWEGIKWRSLAITLGYGIPLF